MIGLRDSARQFPDVFADIWTVPPIAETAVASEVFPKLYSSYRYLESRSIGEEYEAERRSGQGGD